MKRTTAVLAVLVLAVAALGNQRVPKVEFIKGKANIRKILCCRFGLRLSRAKGRISGSLWLFMKD